MKPKPFVLITALIYLGLTLETLAFADDIYNTSNGTYGKPNCRNYTFVEDTGTQPITAEPQIFIINDSLSSKSITYTFSTCTIEDHKCAIPFTKSKIIPPGGTYQHTYQLTVNVRYHHPGNFNYKVMTDITGDITEHAEKACGIHIRRNN